MHSEGKNHQRWFAAARRDDVAQLRILKQSHIKTRTSSGMTALMCASQSGARNAVFELGKREAGLQTKQGYTALMFGVLANNRRIVEFLFPFESNQVLLCDTEDFPAGTTALLIALSCGHIDLVDILLPEARLSKLTNFHLACVIGNWDECIRSIENQQKTDALGRTGLHYSAMYHYNNGMEVLLTRSSDTVLYSTPDQYGFTALHYAAAAGNSQLVLKAILKNVFLEFGSVDTEYARKIRHILRLAKRPQLHSNLTKLPQLIQFGCGLTPLMVAVAYEQLECAQQLYEHFQGLETNCGFTALSIAALYGVQIPKSEAESRVLTRAYTCGLKTGSSMVDIARKSGLAHNQEKLDVNESLRIEDMEPEVTKSKISIRQMILETQAARIRELRQIGED